LRIFREGGGWRGRFLPQNFPESQASDAFRTYPFDEDRVSELLEAFLKRPSDAASSAGEIHLKIQSKSQSQEWKIPKQDLLRRIVLKPSTEWREKRILNEDASRVEEIDFPSLKPPLRVVRDADGKWVLMDKPLPLQQEWLESLARKLSHLRAQSLGELVSRSEAGLEPPQAELLVKMRGATPPFRVLLGKQKQQNLYYAEVQGLPDWQGEIFLINEESAEKFRSQRSQLVEEGKP